MKLKLDAFWCRVLIMMHRNKNKLNISTNLNDIENLIEWIDIIIIIIIVNNKNKISIACTQVRMRYSRHLVQSCPWRVRSLFVGRYRRWWFFCENWRSRLTERLGSSRNPPVEISLSRSKKDPNKQIITCIRCVVFEESHLIAGKLEDIVLQAPITVEVELGIFFWRQARVYLLHIQHQGKLYFTALQSKCMVKMLTPSQLRTRCSGILNYCCLRTFFENGSCPAASNLQPERPWCASPCRFWYKAAISMYSRFATCRYLDIFVDKHSRTVLAHIFLRATFTINIVELKFFNISIVQARVSSLLFFQLKLSIITHSFLLATFLLFNDLFVVLQFQYLLQMNPVAFSITGSSMVTNK